MWRPMILEAIIAILVLAIFCFPCPQDMSYHDGGTIGRAIVTPRTNVMGSFHVLCGSLVYLRIIILKECSLRSKIL